MSHFRCYPPAETHIPFKALRQCLHDNRQIAEQTLREQTGSAHCLIGPSGRALLCRLLAALSNTANNQRREVLIPGYTCYSVAAAVVKAGLKIRFYDLEPKTFHPVVQSVAQNCGHQTLAVISQHLLGIPADVKDLAEIAKAAGACHIEDTAQGLGGRLDNTSLGTSGDFGLFSFGRGKPLPLGGGGALVSNRFVLSKLVPPFPEEVAFQKIAITTLTQLAAHPHVYGIAEKLPLGLGKTEFNPGFKIGTTPLSLINLIPTTMAQLPAMNHHRRTIAAIYQDVIPGAHTIKITQGSTPVYPRFPVLAHPGRLPGPLLRLGVRRLYPNALNQEPPINAFAADNRQRLRGAETLAQNLITLPTHHAIDAEAAKTIAQAVNRWIQCN